MKAAAEDVSRANKRLAAHLLQSDNGSHVIDTALADGSSAEGVVAELVQESPSEVSTALRRLVHKVNQAGSSHITRALFRSMLACILQQGRGTCIASPSSELGVVGAAPVAAAATSSRLRAALDEAARTAFNAQCLVALNIFLQAHVHAG